MASSNGESSTGAVPPKRSFFKKSAFAKPAEEDEAIDFFSRSKVVFPELVAERQKKRQERLERERSTGSVERTDPETQEGKRRRISNEAEIEDDRGSSSDDEVMKRPLGRGDRVPSPSTPPRVSSQSPSVKVNHEASPSSFSKHSNADEKTTADLVKNRIASRPEVISLSDNEDDLSPQPIDLKPTIVDLSELKKPSVDTFRIPVEDNADLSEEEMFPELIAKARETANQRRFVPLKHPDSKGTSEVSSDDGTIRSPHVTISRSVPSSSSDPIVIILVTSRMQGTKPLLIKRKLSQRIKDVRVAWCDKQIIDERPMAADIRASMFLTFRGKRLFDVTTCTAMGLKVNASGNVVLGGDGFDDGKVHLEAWTDDLFTEYERHKQMERKRLQQTSIEEEDDIGPVQDNSKAEEAQGLRIIMRSKGIGDFKLMVKPTTLIGKLISAYRRRNNISDDQAVALHFDGEKLDPEQQVSEYDMDDMTTIDVHVK